MGMNEKAILKFAEAQTMYTIKASCTSWNPEDLGSNILKEDTTIHNRVGNRGSKNRG